jgi:hypothetical protein
MFIRAVFHPAVTLSAATAIALVLAHNHPVLFGPKYAGIRFLTAKSTWWIIVFTFAFVLGAFTGSFEPNRARRSTITPLNVGRAVVFFQRSYRWALLLSFFALLNALWRWWFSITTAVGLNRALSLIQESSTVWRTQYVIHLDIWNGWFLPSEMTPFLFLYCAVGIVLHWAIKRTSVEQAVVASSSNNTGRGLKWCGATTLVTMFLISLLIRDRMTLLITLIPAFTASFTVALRILPRKRALRTFFGSAKGYVFVLVLLVLAVAVTNYASRGDRESVWELLSINYFITNLASTTFHIEYTSSHAYGLMTLREPLSILPVASSMVIDPTDQRFLTQFSADVILNQAPSVWSYAWGDFGRFGVVYMWILGFVSALLYKRAWTAPSIGFVMVGAMVSTVWILSFHAFQLSLVEYWFNVVVLIAFYVSFAPSRR